jgi:hypothetical protein
MSHANAPRASPQTFRNARGGLSGPFGRLTQLVEVKLSGQRPDGPLGSYLACQPAPFEEMMPHFLQLLDRIHFLWS